MFLKAVAVLIQLAVLLPPSLISGKPDCPPRKVPDASALKEAMNAFVIGGVVPDLLPQFTPLAIMRLVPNAPYFDLEFPDKLLSPYSPPAPPEASGFHRYTFLLYPGQPSPESIDDFEHKYPSRYHFNLRQFVAEAGLCDPIAGIFMFTENSKDEAKNLVH
ncbi:hypothetical protein PGTUg99_031703 [Puccinia graminis f. sp. tritici]|uniref:Phosphatidylethanolamine-binding protein n=1 Tax=Puccinia graminis f. sp. tritici TaxID=56615 RepID=A0A5B0RVG6_PUCGR|nr:hypothetical protein PGTUg99_031703 [Puccinia graminis f. sp. tritici]